MFSTTEMKGGRRRGWTMSWSLQTIQYLPAFLADLPYLWLPGKLRVFSHDMGIPKIAGQSAGSVPGLLGITHETSFCHSAYQHFPLQAGYSDIPSKDNTTIFSSSGIHSGLSCTIGLFKLFISFAALASLLNIWMSCIHTHTQTHTVKAYCTAKESYLTNVINFLLSKDKYNR